jgi:predicted dehydrogenase
MIGAAIVGLGGWGRRLVESASGQSERIRFVAGVTRTVAKAADFAAAKGFPVGADYAAVLADRSVDAVVLATPHSQHCDQIVQAAAAGKHVYVEKPFTLDRASAERAVESCRKAGVTLAVGFNRRFRPAVREVHRLVSEGRLGEVVHLEGDFHGPPISPPIGWRLSARENPGGGMTGKGIHVADAMIWMAGPIASVFAFSDSRSKGEQRDDTTSLTFRFASGATGQLSTILVTPEFWRLHVFGTHGWAEVRGERILTTRFLAGTAQTVEYPDNNSLAEALGCFADAVEGRGSYPVTAEDAINGAALLEGLTQSVAAGAPVRIA